LDERPELLFTLRKVDPAELVDGVDAGAALARGAAKERVLDAPDLGAVFGIELVDDASPPPPRSRAGEVKAGKKKASPKKSARKAPRRPTTYTAQELLDRGVPRPTIQGWLRQGVLEPTGTRGVYRATPLTAERLARYES